MDNNAQSELSAPAEPIIELDLGANGGVFAPTTFNELTAWIQHERSYWSWITQAQVGNHQNGIENLRQQLDSAFNLANEAQNNQTDLNYYQGRIRAVRTNLEQLYVSAKFPHSSSTEGIRVEGIRQRNIHEATAYLYAILPSENQSFDPRTPAAWRGLISGVIDHSDIRTAPEKLYESALKSAEDLRTKLEQELGSKKKAFASLHGKYDDLVKTVTTSEEDQRKSFSDLMHTVNTNHQMALQEHKDAMTALQNTFRISMALRGPVEYWESQRRLHSKQSREARNTVIVSMFLLAVLLLALVAWLLGGVKQGSNPEVWKLAALGLIGVLGIWAIRLIIRMYLSHYHLSNDAAERVTMVKTYLALHEDQKVPNDDDRKLVLGALFRHVSDGIVKEEGIPNPLIDILTKLR